MSFTDHLRDIDFFSMTKSVSTTSFCTFVCQIAVKLWYIVTNDSRYCDHITFLDCASSSTNQASANLRVFGFVSSSLICVLRPVRLVCSDASLDWLVDTNHNPYCQKSIVWDHKYPIYHKSPTSHTTHTITNNCNQDWFFKGITQYNQTINSCQISYAIFLFSYFSIKLTSLVISLYDISWIHLIISSFVAYCHRYSIPMILVRSYWSLSMSLTKYVL